MHDYMIKLMPNRKEWCKKFIVKPIPGKGAAVSAAVDLKQGEMLLAESPIFTLPFDRNQDAVVGGLAACNSEYRRMFYDMFNCHEETEEMTYELGVFATNGIPCGTDFSSGREADREGVFVISARMNHSCVPNLHSAWVDWVHQLEQRAVRPIKKGEEITRAYVDPLQTRKHRQRELMEKYWFKCKCETCSLTGEKLETSDRRRTRIRKLLDKHSNGRCEDAYEGLIEIREALDCIEHEGLKAYESMFYFFGFHLCAASSDYVSAIEWAQKAQTAHHLLFGESLGEIYERLVANPGCYPDANTMPKRTLAGPDSPSWATTGTEQQP